MNPQKRDELEEWVNTLRQNPTDEIAITELLRRLHGYVQSILVRRGFNPNNPDVQELYGDIQLAIYEGATDAKRYKGDAPFRFYVAGIVRNQLTKLIRKRGKDRQRYLRPQSQSDEEGLTEDEVATIMVNIPDNQPGPEQWAEWRECVPVVEKVLGEFTLDDRTTLILYYFHHGDPTNPKPVGVIIGEALGIENGVTVRQRIRRLKDKLGTRLSELGIEPIAFIKAMQILHEEGKLHEMLRR
jgi:RNA polymerase sigma factor (sigma-70 family)